MVFVAALVFFAVAAYYFYQFSREVRRFRRTNTVTPIEGQVLSTAQEMKESQQQVVTQFGPTGQYRTVRIFGVTTQFETADQKTYAHYACFGAQKEAEALAMRLAPGTKHLVVPDPEIEGYAYFPKEASSISWSEFFGGLGFAVIGAVLFVAGLTGDGTDQ